MVLSIRLYYLLAHCAHCCGLCVTCCVFYALSRQAIPHETDAVPPFNGLTFTQCDGASLFKSDGASSRSISHSCVYALTGHTGTRLSTSVYTHIDALAIDALTRHAVLVRFTCFTYMTYCTCSLLLLIIAHVHACMLLRTVGGTRAHVPVRDTCRVVRCKGDAAGAKAGATGIHRPHHYRGTYHNLTVRKTRQSSHSHTTAVHCFALPYELCPEIFGCSASSSFNLDCLHATLPARYRITRYHMPTQCMPQQCFTETYKLHAQHDKRLVVVPHVPSMPTMYTAGSTETCCHWQWPIDRVAHTQCLTRV
eukprot:6990-Heterococcus_DN1.PRE.6